MVNIGILGLGNIARRVAKGVLCSPKARLYAVASRNSENAESFKNTYGAEKAYGSYEAMLEDEEVDLVYICTPNTLHFEQIMLCLSYGKHVICEKPMVANEVQVKTLFAEAKKQGCFLMEAEKTMFLPLHAKLKTMIKNGVIGKLQTIRAEYSSEGLKDISPDHWVLEKNMGGASYDIGVYPISFSHLFAEAKMREFKVQTVRQAGYECDFGMQADVFYENGIYADLKCNWLYQPRQKGDALLIGETGYIEIPAYWKTSKAYLHKDGAVEEITVPMESDFEGEITHAAECVEKGLLESPVLGEEMSLEIIRIIEKANDFRRR